MFYRKIHLHDMVGEVFLYLNDENNKISLKYIEK